MFHSFSSSIVLTKLRQKLTMNVTFIVVFCFSHETRVEDNIEHASSFFFSLTLQKTMTSHPTHRCFLQFKERKNRQKTHKRSMSLLVRHRPLQPKKKNLDVSFSWVARDNDEPSGSSSSLSFFSSFIEDNDKPGSSLSSLGFFLKYRR